MVTNFANNEISYVFDNTIKQGLNMLKGTRFKVSLDGMLGLKTTDTNMVSANQVFLGVSPDLYLQQISSLFPRVVWCGGRER